MNNSAQIKKNREELRKEYNKVMVEGDGKNVVFHGYVVGVDFVRDLLKYLRTR